MKPLIGAFQYSSSTTDGEEWNFSFYKTSQANG